ncbi:PQQ-dependent catabolism-associated CXXCW motif protein [Skermanella pratensis]|uniref:PQQ-dependent catabolism-associated CXXCW motif protein n=1 Tax=Skermanella pratensis TaxID=2233999 RepID=UPI001FECB36F|nr:PQQ-dependent catabolism-associated CXXCW motif protein [Skermanella pratensis]
MIACTDETDLPAQVRLRRDDRAVELSSGGGTGPGMAADTRPGSDVPLPDGYRLDHYRAPVPSHVPGAATVSLEEAEALHKAGTVLFIDVMKVPRAAFPGVSGKWLVAKPHVAIAGSTWLPEVGEGRPDPVVENYFRRNLERLTKGDAATGLLFYCVTDCWMSWNAAKRALSWGYRRVYWFRDGIDVWQQFDLPTEIVDPVPLDAG